MNRPLENIASIVKAALAVAWDDGARWSAANSGYTRRTADRANPYADGNDRQPVAAAAIPGLATGGNVGPSYERATPGPHPFLPYPSGKPGCFRYLDRSDPKNFTRCGLAAEDPIHQVAAESPAAHVFVHTHKRDCCGHQPDPRGPWCGRAESEHAAGSAATPPDPAANFEGHTERECGEHRTVGPHRAWCYDCTEWCYPRIDAACKGCLIPHLRANATGSTPPEANR